MEVNPVETRERGETVSLGPFLRREREKMNLSQDQMAEKLRLRRFIVEAIENETWERLPPPVFVKGFVRSYARALELDEKNVLDLYSRAAPPEMEILKPVALTRPPDRIRVLLLLLALAALACIVYFWYVKSSARNRESFSMVERTVPAYNDLNRQEKTQQAVEIVLPAIETATPASPEQNFEAQPKPENIITPSPETEPPKLTLKGFVKEKTWISIRIDGNEAREFIFHPGARPQWVAGRGFVIVVGNAGGMDFELDGKRIENLGQPGKVVRLSLPEGFDPRAREE